MFATTSLFADGSLDKDPESTSDPRDIFGARKKNLTPSPIMARKLAGILPLHMSLSNIGRTSIISRVAPVGGQSRRFGALCGTRDAYSANRTGLCSPSVFFFFFTRWEREKETDRKRTRHWRTWWIICPGTALIATLGGGGGFWTSRIMITSILYLQRERSLRRVRNSNRSNRLPAAMYTHVRVRMPDLCVLPLEFIGSRGERSLGTEGKRKRGKRGVKGTDVSPEEKSESRKRGEGHSDLLATNLTSVDPRSLEPLNFPSTSQFATFRPGTAQAWIRSFVFVTRDCNRWPSRFFIQRA